MLGKKRYYYPQTLKRILLTVMGLFSNVIVYKYDKNGEIIGEVDVELIAGPTQIKHKARTNEEQQQFMPKFPRIEVHIEGLNINESRIISPNTERFWNGTLVNKTVTDHNGEILLALDGLIKDFNPIPYDYVFSVNIFTEYIDHMSQIMENIFPYFGPSNTTMRIKEFAFLNIERDLKVTLGNPSIQYEGTDIAPGETRKLSCNFSITVEGFMYRKVESVKIINNIAFKMANENQELEQTPETILNGEVING